MPDSEGETKSVYRERVGKVMVDLEGETDDGTGNGEVRMGGTGRGKGRMGEMNIIE